MSKKSFVLHIDSLSIIDELNDEQAGKLFRAIFQYHLGEVVTVEEDVAMAFKFFKNQFDKNNK